MEIILQSNIDVSGIDATYPVEGKSNPSSGMRNNFSEIKNAISVARSEINNLIQTTAKVEGETDLTNSKFIGGEHESGIYRNVVLESGTHSVTSRPIVVAANGSNPPSATTRIYPSSSNYYAITWSNDAGASAEINIVIEEAVSGPSEYSCNYIALYNNVDRGFTARIIKTGALFKKNTLALPSSLSTSGGQNQYSISHSLNTKLYVVLKIESFNGGGTFLVTPTFVG